MSEPIKSRSLVVFEDDNGTCQREFRDMELGQLDPNSVRVQVQCSSLNYKDALCSTGHPGVARTLPLVPGIDAAGTVVESNSAEFQVGQDVMIFHAKFGTQVNGAYSQLADVPADFVYPLPAGLSHRDAMILGTAGFTAAQSVDQLIRHNIHPETGPIVVTGSTGGVGIVSVCLLAKLGYEVVAVTGKTDRYEMLKQLGASDVIGRDAVNDTSDTPLLKGRWAGAVDTVGGNTLATLLRTTKPHGCVTACGLVGGTDFSISVYPFILRGVALQGIDTATIPYQYRSELWQKLAGDWKLECLSSLAIEVALEELEPQIDAILKGAVAGRVIVRIAD